MHFDVFNGDADGIIALLQLRLAEPKTSQLVTGVKRDIELLQQVDVNQAKSVTVLDISMEKNHTALVELLNSGVDVFYADHHRVGDIPQSERLTSLIDTDANTCTSLIINHYLGGKYAHWAVAAAFGDNMNQSAMALAEQLGISATDQELLKQLGIVINYNGYGNDIGDLHYHPKDLYQALLEYPDPLLLVNQSGSIFEKLNQAYQADIALAESAQVVADNDICQIVLLDDAPWARRVSGVYGNLLANRNPDKAHAVLTKNSQSNSEPNADSEVSYTVSLRAPLNNKQGAGDICVQFPTGGGRSAAAGINQLPENLLENFVEAVTKYYQ
ncbi:DHH family phosphoesterase [Endozoicomonas sp. G2_1]|uniref:DHH family phosphoesterase n=1 Tax=Endozoicomonas sp. G2_1 TaxID=2821091 RepID=UPI001ADA7D57|nr:DHH family phosphoesterase [Endozoicomonas sp. G2_1]MBO9488977.1 DHH family phosphoesterase [Endozoicomonas sp. G2_1]